MLSFPLKNPDMKRQKSSCSHRNDHVYDYDHIRADILAAVDKRLHLCSAFAATIAPGLHCHGKVIGSPERRDKQRHENWNHGLGLLDNISTVQIRSPCDLGFHNLV